MEPIPTPSTGHSTVSTFEPVAALIRGDDGDDELWGGPGTDDMDGGLGSDTIDGVPE